MKISMRSSQRQVKGTRAYDISRREADARRRRAAALDHARALFFERGYAATTVEAIAQAAGISSATIYKSYGGKAGLVRALAQRALAGAGPVPAEKRSNALRDRSDPREVIEGWGQLVSEVSPRIAPLLLLLRDVAQIDPEASRLYDELDQARLARMSDNARFLAEAGHLREGVTARDARDVLWLASSPELYDMLIRRRRWTVAKYSRFVTETMASALLDR